MRFGNSLAGQHKGNNTNADDNANDGARNISYAQCNR